MIRNPRCFVTSWPRPWRGRRTIHSWVFPFFGVKGPCSKATFGKQIGQRVVRLSSPWPQIGKPNGLHVQGHLRLPRPWNLWNSFIDGRISRRPWPHASNTLRPIIAFYNLWYRSTPPDPVVQPDADLRRVVSGEPTKKFRSRVPFQSVAQRRNVRPCKLFSRPPLLVAPLPCLVPIQLPMRRSVTGPRCVRIPRSPNIHLPPPTAPGPAFIFDLDKNHPPDHLRDVSPAWSSPVPRNRISTSGEIHQGRSVNPYFFLHQP